MKYLILLGILLGNTGFAAGLFTYQVHEAALQGENFRLTILPSAEYKDQNLIIESSLDGDSIILEEPYARAWRFDRKFYTIKDHSFSLTLYREDKKLADGYRAQIFNLTTAIEILDYRISQETDPVKLAELIQERDQKVLEKQTVETKLAALKKLVGTEDYIFTVSPNGTNLDIPNIQSFAPSVGTIFGGTRIEILGERFSQDAIAKIGGEELVNLTITENSIVGYTPNFVGSSGLKDLEVILPPLEGETEVRNALVVKGYYVNQEAPLDNVRPIAVAGGSNTINLGEDVELDGRRSFDPNGDHIVFKWLIKKSPENSFFAPGEIISTDRDFTFMPDLAGIYVFELYAEEDSTEQMLQSEPSLAILEVNEAPLFFRERGNER